MADTSPKSVKTIKKKGRLVIKVGTSSMLNERIGCLALKTVASLVDTIVTLRLSGWDVVLVTSGSVGFGRLAMQDPLLEKVTLSQRRALASIGQAKIMEVYSKMFGDLKVKCAQMLLTYRNLGIQSQYSSSKDTFEALLDMGVVPIVNENDPVADRIKKFGDNDCLAAMIAILIGAKKLYLLTDVDGLYTANPQTDPLAKRIPVVRSMKELIDVSTATKGSQWGTGGMATKLKAAEIASNCNVCTIIMKATQSELIADELDGKDVGTKFLASSWGTFANKRARKHWICSLPIRGELVIDNGAARAIRQKHSLFAAGVRHVKGDVFTTNSVVRICGLDGRQIALGLVNYDRDEIISMKGKRSSEIEMDGPSELIHRSNIALDSSEHSDDEEKE